VLVGWIKLYPKPELDSRLYLGRREITENVAACQDNKEY
jgi:hypothetical protein